MCHKPENETRHLLCPERELETDPACVYMSIGGVLGGICVWVLCSTSVWGGLKKRGAVRERKTSGRVRGTPCRIADFECNAVYNCVFWERCLTSHNVN